MMMIITIMITTNTLARCYALLRPLSAVGGLFGTRLKAAFAAPGLEGEARGTPGVPARAE